MTVRNIDDSLKKKLRVRAAHHGHSMEDEVRDILRSALSEQAKPSNLLASIRSRLPKGQGFDLELPSRELAPEPLDLSR